MKQSRIRKQLREGWIKCLAETDPSNTELIKALQAMIK